MWQYYKGISAAVLQRHQCGSTTKASVRQYYKGICAAVLQRHQCGSTTKASVRQYYKGISAAVLQRHQCDSTTKASVRQYYKGISAAVLQRHLCGSTTKASVRQYYKGISAAVLQRHQCGSTTKASVRQYYKGISAAVLQSSIVSECIVRYSTFCKLWNQLLPYVIIYKPVSDLCWTCQLNNTRIVRQINVPENEECSASATRGSFRARTCRTRALSRLMPTVTPSRTRPARTTREKYHIPLQL